ncbi:MAG: hypothetical protein JXR53_08005 [Bacteroidales bacterium]|nr:hypothetical protein [Bacteroidales bacterium]
MRRINLNELGFDVAMLLVTALTYFVVFPSGIIPQAGDRTFFYQNLIVLVEFVFAFVLGKEGMYFLKKQLDVAKWRKYYYFATAYSMVAIAYIIIPIALDAVGIFAYAVGFFACIMGFATGRGIWNENSDIGQQIKTRKAKTEESIKEKEEKKTKSYWLETVFENAFTDMSRDYPVLLGLPVLFLFYAMVFFFNIWGDSSGILGVLAFLGIVLVPVAGMVIFGLFAMILSILVTKIRIISKGIDAFLMKFFFPMLFAFLFLLWNEVYFFCIIGEDASALRVILLSIFLGLIPYRFLLMIRPPVNYVNIFIAVISFVLYFGAIIIA